MLLSSQGMSLLNVILLLMLIGVLTTAGVKMVGPLVHRGKTNETKTAITSAVDALVSWAVAQGRLPKDTEFQSLLPNPHDAWGKPLTYTYDDDLTAVTSGGLCGRTSSRIYAGQQVAFAVISGGDDYVVDSLPSSSQKFPPTLDIKPSDVSRLITLDELKARAGCAGYTTGSLRVVNNELPTACKNTLYSATISATGGVPGYSFTISGLPPGLSASGATISGTPSLTGATPETYAVTVRVSDGQTPAANVAQRSYMLKVAPCSAATPGTPANPITFTPPSDPTVVTDNWNGGAPSDEGTNNTDAPSGKFDMTVTNGTLSAISLKNGTSSSCIWFQRPLTLTNKKLRAYFQYVFQEGAGLVFAMAPAADGQTTISSCDENSRLGFGPGIPGSPLLGAEFIVNNWTTGTGPGSHCVSTNGTICTATGAGVNSWTTGTTVYYVRIELDATVTPYRYKVWLTSNASYKTALKDLSTPYPDSGLSADIKLVPQTLASIMSSFFMGFTTGQHGNDKVNMSISDLGFALY